MNAEELKKANAARAAGQEKPVNTWTLSITANSLGQIAVDGPLGDKPLCFKLIAHLAHAVVNFEPKKHAPLVIPAGQGRIIGP